MAVPQRLWVELLQKRHLHSLSSIVWKLNPKSDPAWKIRMRLILPEFFFERKDMCVTDFRELSPLFVRNVRKAPNRGLESSLLPLLNETLSKPWMKNIYRALPALKTDDLNIYYKNENLLWKNLPVLYAQ